MGWEGPHSWPLRRLGEMQGRVRRMRDALYEGIARIVLSQAKLNGHPEKRLPNTLNVTLPGIRGGRSSLRSMPRGSSFPPALPANRVPRNPPTYSCDGSIRRGGALPLRFSLGIENTEEQLERALQLVRDVVTRSEGAVRFVSCR